MILKWRADNAGAVVAHRGDRRCDAPARYLVTARVYFLRATAHEALDTARKSEEVLVEQLHEQLMQIGG